VSSTGSYIVLARKWRPGQFSDIVGQSHIVRTLMNAIRAQRIHQAYLFTGSRGIGKTSIARIFAKVIRCENTQMVTDARGEWLKSCDQCASCREITSGTSIDVIEIDGASNNGVEAVREIRENAKYLPATGSRKIYIIDEVHMLTTAAFNALLKTLEEPPAHVIFIFATTEPHKIPATILSRVQRFDYRRVTLAQIQQRLTEVTQAEGVAAEPAALALIARAAEGSMRDSLSLLDQVIAFSGNQITVSSVRDSIGLVEGQTLLGILDGIFKRKPLDALSLVDQAYTRGHDLRVLTRSLIEFLHAAILAKVGAENSGSLELSTEEWSELVSIASHRELEEIEMIFQVMHHGLEWIARSPQPKIVLDVLVVKCATAEALMFADAPPSLPPQSNPPATGGSARPLTHATSSAGPSSVSSAMPAAPTAPKTSAAIAPQQASSFGASASITAARPSAPQPQAAPTVAASATPATPAPQVPTGPLSWEGFIETVRKTRPLLASILEHGSCVSLPSASNEQQLQLAYQPKDSYFRDQLQSRVYNEQLLALTKEYFGKTTRVQLEIREAGESLAEKKRRELEEKQKNAREAARNHPTIVEAKALFGGELGPIELSESLLAEQEAKE
jgi:DNA polymerase-3 subunit gamma/tau